MDSQRVIHVATVGVVYDQQISLSSRAFSLTVSRDTKESVTGNMATSDLSV